jgi:sulfur relay (sulfurtransferase) DsrF/TusC family protein
MISNNERLTTYLNTVINSVFKILPLYEEENVGLETYIESLLFELYGLDKVVGMEQSYEYVSLLSTLESVKIEVVNEESKKTTVKREVFKCINIIKNMVVKLEEGE